MKNILMAGVISLFLVGCSNPKSAQIPTNPEQWDELKTSVEKLNEKDKELLTMYLMRKAMGTAFGGEDIKSGTTIGDAIKEQQQWLDDKSAKEKAEAELKAKIEAENKALKKQIDSILTTTIISKSGSSRYKTMDTITDIEFELAFQNHSDKDIAGFKGVASFKDMFDDTIQNLNLSYDDGVKANSTARYHGGMDYNQFMSNETKLLNTDLDKIKFEFIPSVIMFTDGTKIEMKKSTSE